MPVSSSIPENLKYSRDKLSHTVQLHSAAYPVLPQMIQSQMRPQFQNYMHSQLQNHVRPQYQRGSRSQNLSQVAKKQSQSTTSPVLIGTSVPILYPNKLKKGNRKCIQWSNRKNTKSNTIKILCTNVNGLLSKKILITTTY